MNTTITFAELIRELSFVETKKKNPTIEIWASEEKQFQILSIYQNYDDKKIIIDIGEVK
jgi:hypothetical protein